MKTIHYFSPWLKSLKKYQPVWAQIESALTAENEIYDFVPNAADIGFVILCLSNGTMENLWFIAIIPTICKARTPDI